MRRKDATVQPPVTVTRTRNTFERLIQLLKEARSGTFLVTVHNGTVVKLAKVDPPTKIQATPETGTPIEM